MSGSAKLKPTSLAARSDGGKPFANPRKCRYAKAFGNLAEDNTHIIAIVLFGFTQDESGRPVANNYVATAYQKEVR